MRVFFVSFVVSILLVGCALHPLPKDWSGIPTTQISHHIRCESQRALRRLVADYLIAFRDSKGKPHFATEQVGWDLKTERKKFSNTLLPILHNEARKRLEDFEETAIVYAFRFRMTEDNAESGSLTLTMPFTNGSVSIGLGESLVKQRVNERKFKIKESFGAATTDLKCDNTKLRSENYIYPITGSIGMYEVLTTFVDLTLKKGLNPGDAKVPTFSETLTFATAISGSVSPKLTLKAVADRWRVTEASGALSAGRIDEHEVSIGLNLASRESETGIRLSKSARKAKAQDDAARALDSEEQIRALREFTRGI